MAIVAIATLGPQVAGAAAKTNCGLISSKSWGGGWLTRSHVERVVAIRGVRCVTAKRIAHLYNHNPAVLQPGGWACHTSHAFSSHVRPPYVFECGKSLAGQSYRHFFIVRWG